MKHSRLTQSISWIAGAFLAVFISVLGTRAEGPEKARPDVPHDLAPPVEKGHWLLPASGKVSEPVWGIKGGISVGLWPTGGPRGLFRIYTPYLGQPRLRMINYIAIEPVVGNVRCLSELESSVLDKVPGKAMWSGNELELEPKPRKSWEPATGKEVDIGDNKALTVFVFVERFDNGARPVVQLNFRQDRPHEVGFKVFAARGSAPMKSCILTATMGNYARLRHLWLNDQVVDSREIWPAFKPNDSNWGFAAARQWQVGRMLAIRNDVVVAVTSNEASPAQANYAKEVPAWWRYEGKPATQYWRAPRQKELLVRVNGRRTFWASKAVIPGGISFENFELEAPFKSGQEFFFGVTSAPPEKLGFNAASRKNLDGR